MKRRAAFRFPWRTRSTIGADVRAELEFHLAMRTEELMLRGMSEREARQEAEREFGDRQFTERYCERMDLGGDRAERWRSWWDGLWRDLRVTARAWRLHPSFAMVVIATLGLAVGANTAVFGVLDSVLLRRLPFPRADRLVTVDELNMRIGLARSDIAVAEYLDWVARQRSFTGIAVHGSQSLTYAGGPVPVLLAGRKVSANFFDVFGVRAALGRTFVPGEDRGVHRVVVLADGAWRRLFGADPEIVGRQIILGGNPYTVVGVLPPEFTFPGLTPRDFFVPADLSAAMADVNRARKFHFLHGFARLRDGVSVEEARAELTGIARAIERENPGMGDGHLVTVMPLEQALVGGVRSTILSLMGAAAFVLLIAAATLGNLALTRALLRRRELAVRAALGASRGRLARATVAEGVVLAVLGGALGIAIARVGTPALLSLYPSAIPPSFEVHVSGPALAFGLAAAVAAGIAIGLVPAIDFARHDLAFALGNNARDGGFGRVQTKARSALVTAQIALAMVLLVGASLLVRTVVRLQSLELGFAPEHVSFVWLPLSGERYREPEAVARFWRTLADRLRREPTIDAAGVAGTLPLTGGSGASLAIEGRPNTEPLPEIRYSTFSPGLARTIGVPIVAGRDFDESDRAGGRGVVLVNESAARKFWPNASPIGARVRLGPDPSEPWSEVVGVIGDYRQEQLDAPPPPLAVTMYQQDTWSSMLITVRSNQPPVTLQATIARAVHELDPALAVGVPTPLGAMVAGELGQRRFATSVLLGFGLVALALAVLGVYGVVAYSVASRQRELGVRLALGAFPRQLVAGVLAYGARMAAIGLSFGAVAAVFLTRFLAGLLYEVQPLDVATFVMAGLVLGGATAAACWLPARRAAAVDPVIAIRAE